MKQVAEGPMHYVEYLSSCLESEDIHCIVKEKALRVDSALLSAPGPMELSRLFVMDEDCARAEVMIRKIEASIETDAGEEDPETNAQGSGETEVSAGEYVVPKLQQENQSDPSSAGPAERKWWITPQTTSGSTTSARLMVGLASAIGVGFSRYFGIVVVIPAACSLLFFFILRKWFNRPPVSLFQVSIALVWAHDAWFVASLVTMHTSIDRSMQVMVIIEIVITVADGWSVCWSQDSYSGSACFPRSVCLLEQSFNGSFPPDRVSRAFIAGYWHHDEGLCYRGPVVRSMEPGDEK